MPEGVLWLASLIKDNGTKDRNSLHYLENISVRTFYDPKYRSLIRNSANLRDNFVAILDKLIDRSSSSTAYVIREYYCNE